jgi:hypothetical protein
VTASTHLAPPAEPAPPPESSPAVSLVATFLPLLFIVVMFFAFLRVVRRSNARAEESVRLSREIVNELRAIRAALAPPGTTKAPEPQSPQREHTLSGQTIETK